MVMGDGWSVMEGRNVSRWGELRLGADKGN